MHCFQPQSTMCFQPQSTMHVFSAAVHHVFSARSWGFFPKLARPLRRPLIFPATASCQTRHRCELLDERSENLFASDFFAQWCPSSGVPLGVSLFCLGVCEHEQREVTPSCPNAMATLCQAMGPMGPFGSASFLCTWAHPMHGNHGSTTSSFLHSTRKPQSTLGVCPSLSPAMRAMSPSLSPSMRARSWRMWILSKVGTTTATTCETLIFPATASCQTTATLRFAPVANCWMSSPLIFFFHSVLSNLHIVYLCFLVSFFCLGCL